MEIINDDIIIEISKYMNIKTLLVYNSLNKHVFKLLDNNFYKELAYKMYTKEFWIKAKERPVTISNPLKLWKYEIKRIEKFQNCMIEVYNKRLTNEEFYNYWNKQLKILQPISMI